MLNRFILSEGSDHACDGGLPAVSPVSFITPGINYSYYTGTWDVLPDFSTLTPDQTGLNDSIEILDGWADDNFGAVYTGYIEIPIDGNYTFYTASDEGSKLYIDDVPVVDNDGIHTLTEASGSICLDEGFHQISVAYFEKTGGEGLTVQFEGPGVSKRRLENLYALGDCENVAIELPEDAVAGIAYYYYQGSWSTLPDFDNEELLSLGTTSSFNFSMAKVSDNFGLVYKAYLNVPKDGDYTFYLKSDDGSKLYVDGLEIVNNDGKHGATETALGSLCLAEGWHELEVAYFEATGGQSLSVQWSGDGFSQQNVTGLFTRPVTAPKKQDQSITFNRLDRYLGEADFEGATVSSGLPLSYHSYHPDVVSVVDGKLHLVGEGQALISVYQPGNLYYNSVNSTAYFTVQAKVNQTITVSDTIRKEIGDEDFSPATVSSGLPVEYTSYKYSVATIADGKIHIVGPGTAFIRAYQIGNYMFLPATRQIFALIVENASSIEDALSSKIKIYPNPVSDVATLQFEPNTFQKIEVYNIYGLKVYEKQVEGSVNETHLHLASLPEGAYHVTLKGLNELKTIRLIKK